MTFLVILIISNYYGTVWQNILWWYLLFVQFYSRTAHVNTSSTFYKREAQVKDTSTMKSLYSEFSRIVENVQVI